MNDVTRILSEIGPGDPSAAERLLPLVYDELCRFAAARMANERADHTLDATALVHEAYLRPSATSTSKAGPPSSPPLPRRCDGSSSTTAAAGPA